MTSPDETSTRCPNCGAEAGAEYCPECGQSQRVETPTVWAWAKGFFEEVLEIDGRLPRTLKRLLFRPGELTEEWLAGRRARYLRPIRLYLFCSFVFFVGAVAIPEAGSPPDSGIRDFLADNVSGIAEGYEEAGGEEPGLVAVDTLGDSMRTLGPQVFFAMTPVFALLVMGLFRQSRRAYIDHLVFSVHVHSLAFLWLSAQWTLVRALPLGGAWLDLPFLVLLGALVLYVVLALGRVYDVSLPRGGLKGLALVGVHGVLVLAVLFVTSVAADAFFLGAGADLADAHDEYWEIQERFERGDSAGARSMLDDVVVEYRRLEAHLYDAHARYHLGHLLLQSGDATDALKLARQGLIEDSTHVLVLGLAGRAEEALDREDRAREYYRRFLGAYSRRIGAYRQGNSRHVPELEAIRQRALDLGDERPSSSSGS